MSQVAIELLQTIAAYFRGYYPDRVFAVALATRLPASDAPDFLSSNILI